MSKSNSEANSLMEALRPFLEVFFQPTVFEKEIHWRLLGKCDQYEWPVKYLFQGLVHLSCLLYFVISIPPKLAFLLILNACGIIQHACNEIASACNEIAKVFFQPTKFETEIHWRLLGKCKQYEWPVKYLFKSLVHLSCLLYFVISIPPKLAFLLILNACNEIASACNEIASACNEIASAYADDSKPAPSLNLSLSSIKA
ncbi:MAG: hypothetical protein EBY16_07195 [Gammaproteobacteria bacterium]|nr:hypothetical protein [Gammaproteobacteria bacterium]